MLFCQMPGHDQLAIFLRPYNFLSSNNVVKEPKNKTLYYEHLFTYGQ